MSDTTPYSIPREPGRWRAITLAAVMHAVLFAFLWIGIRWQSQTPTAIEAEVWDTQTKMAAPKMQPPPEPETRPQPTPEVKTPVVKSPDIALEREKKRKAEEKKLQEEKLEKLNKEKVELAKKEAEKRTQQAKENERLAKLREEEMRRINGGTGGSGDAPKTQGPRGDPGYASKLATKIKSNTVFVVPPDLQGNPAVEYEVKLFPDGSLRGTPRKIKSSGISAFDEAVLRAIELSQPFPPDKSGTVPSGFPVIHRPKDQ